MLWWLLQISGYSERALHAMALKDLLFQPFKQMHSIPMKAGARRTGWEGWLVGSMAGWQQGGWQGGWQGGY